MGYQAVRTDRWKYIHYRRPARTPTSSTIWRAIPYELKTVVQRPGPASRRSRNSNAELRRLLDETP